jgi:voltage-gated potassium channel
MREINSKETHYLTRRNRELYEAATRRLDTPMMILAVILGVILLVQYFADVSSAANTTLDALSWFIWAMFVAEYLLLMWLAPVKRDMFRDHLLDLFLIVVPFLRPLRVLRLLRAFVGFGAATVIARRVLARRGLNWILLAVMFLIVSGARLTQWFERADPEGGIDSFGDALWWAITTCTTVGYGDITPTSSGGRAVAAVLMILGIGLLSIVTANIASVFVEQDSADEVDDLSRQLADVNTKLDRVLLELETRPSLHSQTGFQALHDRAEELERQEPARRVSLPYGTVSGTTSRVTNP